MKPMRLAVLMATVIVACGDPPGDAATVSSELAGPCDPCLQGSDCVLPLGCFGGVCIDPADPQDCGASDDGDPPEAPPEGGDPPSDSAVQDRGAPQPLQGCEGLCEGAQGQGCDALGPESVLGADPETCLTTCRTDPVASHPEVHRCLLERVRRGFCDPFSLADCLPPWAESDGPVRGSACDVDPQGSRCRCDGFCRNAATCNLFETQAGGAAITDCIDLCLQVGGEDDARLTCMETAAARIDCSEREVVGCFGDGWGGGMGRGTGPTESGCERFCRRSGDCGLVGPGEVFSPGVQSCEADCLAMSQITYCCVVDLVADGNCKRSDIEFCLALTMEPEE